MRSLTPHNALLRYGLVPADVPAGDFEKACFLCRIYDKHTDRWTGDRTVFEGLGILLLISVVAGAAGYWLFGFLAAAVVAAAFVCVTNRRVERQMESIRRTYIACLVKMTDAALRRNHRDLNNETLMPLQEFLFNEE